MKTPRFGHLSLRAAFLTGLLCCACLGAAYRVVQNLQDLNNVRLPAAPSNNDALIYNTTLGAWTNGTVSGGISALNQNQFDSTSTNIKTSPLITNGFFYSSGTTNWPFRVFDTNGASAVYVNQAGNLFLGNQTALSTATPALIDSGATYADSIVSSKAKWKLYSDGVAANTYGIGITAGRFNFFGSSGVAYCYYANDVETAALDLNGNWQIDGVLKLSDSADAIVRRAAANTVEFDSGTTGVANRGTLLAAKYTGRAGTSTSTYNAGGLIIVDTTKTGNVGGGADTLQTNNLPANLFAAAGDSLSFEYRGTNATLASMQFTLNFGTNQIYNSVVTPSASGWVIRGDITRLTATTVLANVEYLQGGSPGSLQEITGLEFTQTLSSATPLWLTGESGVSMTNDDVVKKLCRLRFEPAP